MTRKDVIAARIIKLVDGFDRYVQTFDDSVPFTGEQLTAHRRTIALRRQAGSVRSAVESQEFVTSLRRTLLAWGVGRRASRLVADDKFAEALRAAVPRIEPFESSMIDASKLPHNTSEILWLLIESLDVVENKAKLVAGTKTLHHLLPDLVPPMDRAWTGTFFKFHLPEWQDAGSQCRIFQLAYDQFVSLAQQVRPEQYVTSTGWRTSRTKIIDNALIGFCKLELSDPLAVEEETTNQISFEVAGYPPAKNETLSMLGVGHSHASRVRLLLEQAQLAHTAQGFVPIESASVALDVVVYTPPNQNPADATNYLGGIADVLENKAHRGSLDHLGDLAYVWLYRNDRQIKKVNYREMAGDVASYTVTLRELSG